MTIYRGPGGTGSATSDADTTLYQDFLNQTLAARDAALQAEVNAELAETNAETAETNAETAATNAANSASSASSSASAAATSSSNASSSASAAASSASSASSSASSASSSASAAATSASNAAASATNAASSETAAASSASSAATSATNAATSATNANTYAINAASSASSAATSETNAANSAASASTSASNASAAQSAAEAARDAALSAYDNFDDRYLGSKTADPSTDNDGNPLLTGALYFDTNGQGEMRVWNGSAWKAVGSAVNGTTNRATYTATAGQTAFAIVYDIGFVDVYLNGLKLQAGVEFTATNGTSIVLATGATAGDIVDIVSYGVFSVANLNASLVAATDGAGGSLFNTVAGFITRVMSSAGSAIVGFIQAGIGAIFRWAQDKLRDQVSTSDFNVDPTGATECAAGLQAAMNYAASVGARLIAPRKSTFLIGSGLSIPSALMADFLHSTIKRQPGSVFNMLSNTGGTGIRISNLVVDGNRTADGRVATNPADRFGGIVFNDVTFSELRNVQANNTVNAEDGRSGVYLGNCSNVDLYNVGGSGNDRSCVFINGGSFNRIFGSYTKDNLGSGVTSDNANDCEYYDCLAINSGYSGISINGKRSKGRNLRAIGTASGYAGVNIGHDDANNRADDSIIENIHSYDNLGWGLTVIGSSRVQLRGVYLKGNTNNNLWISNNSSACQIVQITSTASGGNGVLIQSGTGHKIASGEVFGNAYHGIDVESGCAAIITEDVRIYNNGTADNTCAGVLLNGSTGSIVEAECFDNQGTKTQGYGVWLNGGSANVVSAYLHDNKTAPIRETASPSYINRNTRTGTNGLSGTFTATAGQNTFTINNNNARAGMVVLFYAVNSAGTSLGIPRLGTITAGTSFVANLNGTAGGTEGYGYVIV